MPDRFLTHTPESDTRFQYEIIKGLSESVRDLAGSIREMQNTQVGMLERLAKLEANRVGEAVAKVETTIEAVKDRVNKLEQDKDRRDGALGMLGILRVWGPLIFSAIAALWLVGRSVGITPAPPVRIETIPNPNNETRSGDKP